MKIFVYGSLMSGHIASHFLAGQTLLGNVTLPGFRMYSIGKYPGISPEGEFSVHGELWDIDHRLIMALDMYEGVPHNYVRNHVTVYDRNGIMHEADAYILSYDPENTTPIDSGVWRP